MREVILSDKYKYKFVHSLGRPHIHINDLPCPSRPSKLFKFYSANLNNLASLYEAYFWLSKPRDFNDPFDCNLNLIQHDDLVIDNKPNNIEDIGITCFTETNDEWLMWAHYTNNYRGYCIEFNTETFRVKLNKSERLYSLNPVIYLNSFPEIKNTQPFAMEYLLTAKNTRWEYEKEWRFISSINKANKYDRIVFYEPIAVKALYIGYRLLEEEESTFNLIESIFTSKYPQKPIFIVYPDPKKLEMVFCQRYP